MMNFKDAYRAANDEIHGDRSILAGINADKPKKIIYFKPAMSVAVAAAVCLVTVLAYPYITGTFQGDKEAPSKTSEDVMLNSEQTEGQTVTGSGTTFGLVRNTDNAEKTMAAEDVTYDYTSTVSEVQSVTADNGSAPKTLAKEKIVSPAEESLETADTQSAEAEPAFSPKSEAAEEAAPEDDAVAENTVTKNTAAETTALPSPGASAETDKASAGGSAASNAEWYVISVGTDGSEITVNHPEEGETTVKITENTVIVDDAGELLSREALQTGTALKAVTVSADGTAEKIIIIK